MNKQQQRTTKGTPRRASGDHDLFSSAELNLVDNVSVDLSKDDIYGDDDIADEIPYVSFNFEATSEPKGQQKSRVLRPLSSQLTVSNLEQRQPSKKNFRNNRLLVGRDAQVAQLVRIFDSTRLERKRKLVWISGESGTGKTALVTQLVTSHIHRQQQQQQHSNDVFYLAGKFDSQHKAKPFGAFVEAFGPPLVALIERTPTIGDAILRDLADDLAILTRIAPGLGVLLPVVVVSSPHQVFLGEANPAADDTESEHHSMPKSDEPAAMEAQNRLEYVFRGLIRILAGQGTIVLSLDLILALFSDCKNKDGIMIIATYRSNEFQDNPFLTEHEMTIMDRTASDERMGFEEIQVTNLDEDEISVLLCDLLDTDPHKTLDLAFVLWKRTMGNPYFIIETIKSLEASKHIQYNWGECQWTWKIEDIEKNTSPANNVIAHMMDKVVKSTSLEAMKIIACLGASFNQTLITKVAKRESENGESKIFQCFQSQPEWLKECINDGFVEQIGSSDLYRFVHDSIQEAAFSLIEGNKKRFKFKLGLVLCVVDLLNDAELSPTLSQQLPSRTFLSALNLSAGIKAKKQAAIHVSYSYITHGIKALPEMHWKDHFSLTMELYKAAVETSHSCGKASHTSKFCDEILAQPNCPLHERLKVHSMLLEMMNSRGEARGAISLALSVLSDLGFKYPSKKLAMMHVVPELLKTKRMLRGKSREDLLSLPLAKDPDTVLIMEILFKLGRSCYMAQETSLLLVNFLRATQFALKYGISDSSAYAFAGYGFILTVVLKDLRGGSFYCEVSLDWLRKLKSRVMASRTCLVAHLFCLHWTTPTPLMLKAFLEGYEVGFSMGNVFDAASLLNQYLALGLSGGRPLFKLEEDLRAASKQVLEYNQTACNATIMAYLQYTLNLMGKSQVPYILKGEAMDIDEIFSDAESVNGHLQKVYGRIYQLRLAYYFGEYDLGMQLIKKSEEADAVKTMTSQVPLVPTAVFSGLICYSLARQKRRSKYVKRGNRFLAKVEQWRTKGCPNCDHYLALLRAEVADLSGQKAQARQLYEASIAISSRQGLIHDSAVANERLSIFYSRHGDGENSDHYLRKSHSLYLEWGALAKTRQLEELYPTVFSSGGTSEIVCQ